MSDEIHAAYAGHYRGYSLKRAAIAGLRVVLVWHGRVRQRRALGNLDDRLLRDNGLSRAEVDRETGKPFWRA